MARRCSTICLPARQETYRGVVESPAAFRGWLDPSFRTSPELFPPAFAAGDAPEDARSSARLGVRVRRAATGRAFAARPSFARPYMTGWTDAARGPRFLRAFGVPFGALARVFGRTPMYGYRPEVGLGRNGVVGATLRRATRPERLRADDHHPPRDGVKNPVATTVGGGCGLGAALAPTAGADDLRAAYGVFRAAAHDRPPGDRPAAANTDGWAATRQAWSARFPLVVVPRCVPHGWPAIRSRGTPADGFRELSAKVWDAYHADDRRAFAQRPRRLREWAGRTFGAGRVREHVDTLCGRAAEYGGAYAHPGGHRTSTMPDRVMRGDEPVLRRRPAPPRDAPGR